MVSLDCSECHITNCDKIELTSDENIGAARSNSSILTDMVLKGMGKSSSVSPSNVDR